jgi:CelD/BcsL family acetyltransferase involved in cellulose biosynthesis
LPQPGDAPLLAVELVEDLAGLDALERDWDALLSRSNASVFQSFEWLRTWWAHFGAPRPRRRLHVVTIRAAAGLVAVAPLYVESVRVLGAVPLRRLLFVGHGASDHLDVLVARGSEAECIDLLAAHLVAHAELFDVAVLEDIPDGSRTGPLLGEALARRGWRASHVAEGTCPRTALGPTWDVTLGTFSKPQRHELRRKLRNLSAEHTTGLEVIPPGAEVEGALRELVEMHCERWAREGHRGAFADPAAEAFHGEVAGRLARRGWLFLAFLRVDGRRCAGTYGFAFRGDLGQYLTGARDIPGLARYSPGRVLHALSMQHAIADGRSGYDLMRGSERYKYDLGAVDVPSWTVVAYRSRARAAAAAHRAYRRQLKTALRLADEARAVRVAARASGWFSRAVARQIASALLRVLSDLRRISRPGEAALGTGRTGRLRSGRATGSPTA